MSKNTINNKGVVDIISDEMRKRIVFNKKMSALSSQDYLKHILGSDVIFYDETPLILLLNLQVLEIYEIFKLLIEMKIKKFIELDDIERSLKMIRQEGLNCSDCNSPLIKYTELLSIGHIYYCESCCEDVTSGRCKCKHECFETPYCCPKCL